MDGVLGVPPALAQLSPIVQHPTSALEQGLQGLAHHPHRPAAAPQAAGGQCRADIALTTTSDSPHPPAALSSHATESRVLCRCVLQGGAYISGQINRGEGCASIWPQIYHLNEYFSLRENQALQGCFDLSLHD